MGPYLKMLTRNGWIKQMSESTSALSKSIEENAKKKANILSLINKILLY